MMGNAYDALDDGNAIIEVGKDDYVLALWFVGDDDGDWLACAVRKAGQDYYEVTCRFRYRNDDEMNPWLSNDEKNVVTATFLSEHSEQYVLRVIDEIAAEQPYSDPVQRIMVRGGPKRLVRLLKRSGFARLYRGGQA